MKTLIDLPLELKNYIIFNELALSRAIALLTRWEPDCDWHEHLCLWASQMLNTRTPKQIDTEIKAIATQIAADTNRITLIAERTPDGVSYHLPPSPERAFSQELLTAIAAHGIALNQAVQSLSTMTGYDSPALLVQLLGGALQRLQTIEPEALKTQLDAVLTSAAIAAHHVKTA